MTSLRPAEFAGTWYPATAAACNTFFDHITGGNADSAGDNADLVGAIVPHAGWTYSGRTAFRALHTLQHASASSASSASAPAGDGPDVILVFGGHLGPRDPPRILIEGGWDTPYGGVMIERNIAEDVSMAIEGDPETPDHYYEDNALEVLMPMIAKLWPSVPVVTIGVPPTHLATKIGAEVVDRALARGFARPLAIGSTDLTHYGPNYRFVSHGRGHEALAWVKTTNDRAMIELMTRLDAHAVVREAERSRNACCPGAVAATLAAARKLGAQSGTLVEQTTSFDVRGEREVPTSFVGYASLVLSSGENMSDLSGRSSPT